MYYVFSYCNLIIVILEQELRKAIDTRLRNFGTLYENKPVTIVVG